MKAANIEDIYELSPLQQGMLFHTLSAADAQMYVAQRSYRLHGALNMPALERAWQQVIERHAALRTSFHWEANKPLQVVHRRVPLAVDSHDWRALPACEQQERLAAYLEAERCRGIDPAKAPLMRLSLVRLSDDSYQFIWVHHMMQLDGWSVPVVIRDVLAAYEAFCRGQDVQLQRSRPYGDYIEWLQRQDAARAETFWRRTLGGFAAPTALGVDRAPGRLPDEHDDYASRERRLPDAITAALQALAQRHQLTMNTLVQGAWALLLGRYSGAEDVVYGTTSSGRPAALAGVESMVGLFINTLPVRVLLPAHAALLPWLRQLQQQQAQLREYEYSSLAHIQRLSAVPPGQALFESIVVFENYPVDAAVRNWSGSLHVDVLSSFEKTNYPLSLLVSTQNGLGLQIVYNCSRFSGVAMARMLAHMQTLVEGIAADPGRRLADVSLLTRAEQAQLLIEWNDTASRFGGQGSGVSGGMADVCLHQLVEAQAARTPDAVAVVFATNDVRCPEGAQTNDELTRDQGSGVRDQGDTVPIPDPRPLIPGPWHMTYAELDRRGNQLARLLRALGVGPDALAAICMERSLELVIALLGVLKAGGAYVPLDPSYPAERITFMLHDAQARVLMTNDIRCPEGAQTNDQISHLVTLSPCHFVNLAADWPAIAREPAERPPSRAGAANLAYVIYTSGSTGRPKGAMNTHGSICNRLRWMQERYRLTTSDRVLQKTPFSFDVSVWEFFWPLMAGACLVVAAPDAHKDSAYLAALVGAQAVTTVHFVPSMLRLFLDEPRLASCGDLKRVICSGEALDFDLQERFCARLDAELHNLYGPTEAAIDVTAWDCALVVESPSVPIGRPIANTQIAILDARLRPVPIGVAGELHIIGVQLARGYLRRPDLTAAAFVPNPFTTNDQRPTTNDGSDPSSFVIRPSSGARLYKTGDLARYREDGAIEFLGRIDHQVKLRGFRIELGEIETVLRQHSSVQEAVVVSRTVGEDLQLVAYVVPVEDEGRTTNDERRTTKDDGRWTMDDGRTKLEDRRLKIEDSDSDASAPLSSILYPLSSELRGFLAARLPDYMIPPAFVVLDALPLTPSGKLDRRALPEPEHAGRAAAGDYAPPRDEVEQRMARIWCEVLGPDRVGIDDNFFDLGGDSFKAIRIVRQLSGVRVIDLFQHPSIRALADSLAARRGPDNRILHRLTSGEAALTLVCVPYGGGNAVTYQPLARALPGRYALYAVALPGHDIGDDQELKPLEEVASMCVEEIKRTIRGPLALYGHCIGVALTVEIARRLEQAGVALAAVFLGGSFPFPEKSFLGIKVSRLVPLRRVESDQKIHAYLKSLGGFEDVVEPAELQFVMRNFRHDGRCALRYFTQVYDAKTPGRLRAPIIFVAGDADPETRGYQKRYKEWAFFSDAVELAVVDGGGHYFLKHQAPGLAAIIARYLDPFIFK